MTALIDTFLLFIFSNLKFPKISSLAMLALLYIFNNTLDDFREVLLGQYRLYLKTYMWNLLLASPAYSEIFNWCLDFYDI